MPVSGRVSASDGESYEWRITGYGQLRGGVWHTDKSPSEDTIRDNIANPNWGMVVEITDKEGGKRYRTIVGGYPPDQLPGIITLLVEDYG